MTPAHRLLDLLDRLTDGIGRGVAWLLPLMVGVMFLVVVLRYVLDTGSIALQESVTYLHALVFMLAAGYALLKDEHVRVDLFYRAATPRYQAWVNLLGGVFLLLPTCLFLFGMSWDYVAAAWEVREGSREAGGLDGVWLLKTVLLVMPALLLLQGVAEGLRAVLQLLAGGGTPPARPGGEEGE